MRPIDCTRLDVVPTSSDGLSPYDLPWALVGATITHSTYGVGMVRWVGPYKGMPCFTVDFGSYTTMLALEGSEADVVPGASGQAPKYSPAQCEAGWTAFLADRWTDRCP